MQVMVIQKHSLHHGENPIKSPAQAFVRSGELPIKALSSSHGYISLLDAQNSPPSVKELQETLGLLAVASFKRVSPYRRRCWKRVIGCGKYGVLRE